MFSDEITIIDSNRESQDDNANYEPPRNTKKWLFIMGGIVLLIIISLVIIILTQKKEAKIEPISITENDKTDDMVPENVTLPNLNGEAENINNDTEYANLSDTQIEYLSFSDFYQPVKDEIALNIDDYELPLNIKIDGLNYYDLSRKINLDPVIDDLNNDGFAILENPWLNEVNDFYGLYSHLEEKQIPFLITSDFLVYYQQNMFKQVFKGIEETVFYDNLWRINKELYEISKNRYESRLAAIGNINDAILEGQRMEMAFFAVSLELLKPAPDQIAVKGAIEDKTKFTEGDVETLYFNPPPYLRDDVLREVQLIRAAREVSKSPNLLYTRDYKEFAVPSDYRSDAKLNNFYLASTWLNSLFPLEYNNGNCSDCFLDKEDWRLSMIAASLISTDFSNRNSLKGSWAMIYKLMAFFQGLREEIDYVDFRDALIATFGEDYDIEVLFDDQNPEAMENLDKLKRELLTYNFSEIRGAIDKDNPANKKLLGFKMLTGPYWPNDYIFKRLTYPAVGSYRGQKVGPNNLTACEIANQVVRCNGFSLDIVNLVIPLEDNELFIENTNYLNYQREANILKDQIDRDGMWHTSNYWTTISQMEKMISDKQKMPIFAQSAKWQEREINSAIAAWANLQLPLDDFSLTPVFEGQTLGDYFSYGENAYVEPNLALVNELIATNQMVSEMFQALNLNRETNLAAQVIRTVDDDLNMIRDIIKKELKGEKLNEKDGQNIRDFALKFKISQSSVDDNVLRFGSQARRGLELDLRKLKLLAIVQQSAGQKIIVIGPIWDYQERR
ncbi:MAG: hypothetical protein PWQ35_504 [Patescibacteria group bacterium]|nr:hypothetical protein [Patescibacteria group bacterium]